MKTVRVVAAIICDSISEKETDICNSKRLWRFKGPVGISGWKD